MLAKPRRFLPGPSIALENDDEFPSLSVYPDPPDVFPGDDRSGPKKLDSFSSVFKCTVASGYAALNSGFRL